MSHRIGVLLSDRGSNFEALADSIAAGRIPGAEIALVISNREGAPGLALAAARGIATKVIPIEGAASRGLRPSGCWGAAESGRRVRVPRGIHAPALAVFCGRVSAAHSEYSPVAAAVVSGPRSAAAGARIRREIQRLHRAFRGRNLDAGPILAQAIVPVRDDDTDETLSARILAEEHRIYTEAVRLVLSGNIASRAGA
jgi:phosphoribosylglycinamide formyltransferase-1